MSASSDVDSYHLGAYASWRPGAWGLLLGTAHSWHDGKVKRSVAYEGASDELKGRFSGDTSSSSPKRAIAVSWAKPRCSNPMRAWPM